MKIVREHINEKFVEDSDPVTDMGIGTRAQISRWMEERRQLDTDDNALVLCAAHGKLEWVKFLIAAGADVHYWYDYALRWAAENGHLEIVKELLKAGADVHINNDYALRTASDEGHLDVVKELLRAGANVHAKLSTSTIPTALEAAKKKGHQNVVDFLADYIANEKKTKGKAVKESLLEKFVEDSDPVSDMGIGTFEFDVDSGSEWFDNTYDKQYEAAKKWREKDIKVIKVVGEVDDENATFFILLSNQERIMYRFIREQHVSIVKMYILSEPNIIWKIDENVACTIINVHNSLQIPAIMHMYYSIKRELLTTNYSYKLTYDKMMKLTKNKLLDGN
jgi:hypothetical protein